MEHAEKADEVWMRRAVRLAAKGKGRVEPNPPVGAVIVRDGVLVGEGHHERFGGSHAEIRAMEAAGDARKGATLYVTLEPCTGLRKKTPPCCDAVIGAGFRRVVIGTRDPTQDPAVPRLQEAGIQVACGVLEDDCRRIIAPFLKLKLKGRPWVIAKWAMTADGKTATVTGDSKWISCDASRELVHQWRNEVDAVLVGIGTVRRDDPSLTCRVPGGRNPARVVLDSHAALSPESKLVRSTAQAPVIVACLSTAPDAVCNALAQAGCRVFKLGQAGGRVAADELLRRLGAEQMTNLLVEGGTAVLTDFFAHGLVDEVRIFIAPKLFGGATARTPLGGTGVPSPADAMTLAGTTWIPVGSDILLTGYTAVAGGYPSASQVA